MRLACIQIAPELGKFDKNTQRADKLLDDHAPLSSIDWLILPELAFSGYNFSSIESIAPLLEATASGPSTAWARRTAAKYDCLVTVGYPELSTDVCSGTSNQAASDAEEQSKLSNPLHAVPDARASYNGCKCYNSAVTVNPSGQVVLHYRKTFLYYTDVTWARPGNDFGYGEVVLPSRISEGSESLVRVAQGICMDINPENFVAEFDAFEFANHCINKSVQLVTLSMAWLHALDYVPEETDGIASVPSLDTVNYWLNRLAPLVEAPSRTVVVCANRAGVEGSACYAGTSSIMTMGHGEVAVFNPLGRGEEDMLIVDTEAATPVLRFKVIDSE